VAIDFEIPEDAKKIRERVRQWVQDECIPAEKRLVDKESYKTVLAELRAKARAQGLWLPFVPKEYGGMGLGPLANALVQMELGQSHLGALSMNSQGPDDATILTLLAHGTEYQKEKFLKPLLNKSTGYFAVCLSGQGRLQRIDIHRLVALTFLGSQPSPSHLVAHNDGVRTNNCVANLRWATQQENLSDMWRHGTTLTGSANPMCKLDEIDREAIRRMKLLGIPRTVIAEGYGVHKRTVFRVLASVERGGLQ